jgi:hypothetical protein
VSTKVSPNSDYQLVVKLIVRYHPDSLERVKKANLPGDILCEMRPDDSLLPGTVIVDHMLEDGRISASVDLSAMERAESE